MNKLRNYILLAVILSLFSCEVTFNETLREYVDNVSERSPLQFTLTDNQIIDETLSYNFGFNATANEAMLVIKNDESVDIHLNSFTGISGDFSIDAFDSFVLEKGDVYTLPVTYNPTFTPGQRVSSEVVFSDVRDRKYSFTIWGTSRRQPLIMLDENDEIIENYDLGNWLDIEQTLKIKNIGLSNITVIDITPPQGIIVNSSTTFELAINEVIELGIRYNDNSRFIDGESININSDHNLEDHLYLDLYAGGSLPLEIRDEEGALIGNSYDFNQTSEPITKTFTIFNSSEFDIDLSASIDSSVFLTALGKTIIEKGESESFEVTFSPPKEVGEQSGELTIRDSKSDRSSTVLFTGTH